MGVSSGKLRNLRFRLGADEFLQSLALDVANIEIPLGVHGDAVNPVQRPDIFVAFADRDGPKLLDFAVGVHPHDELILGRWVLTVPAPPLRGGATDPEFILRRNPQSPGHD